MSKRTIEAVYPLSPMQQGMLFHSLYAPESGVYVEQLSCTLRGDLDIPAFQRAWQRVVDRHAVLRTSFVWRQLDKTLQVVHRRVTVPLEQQDWRGLSPAQQRARLDAFLQQERRRGFDLSRPPLVRLALMRTAEDAHTFVWSHHHILLDGWSLPLILGEVFALYEAFRQGRDLYLKPPRPYRDYIAWLQRQDLAKAEAFWRETLAGLTAPTPLVVDRATEAGEERDEAYGVLESHLPAATTATLQALARQHRLTLSTLVQGAWALLLHRYSGEDDVVFGATVSGRPPDLPGVETMVGLFINTLPVRAQIRPETPVAEWLRRLQAQLAAMRQYEYSPLVQVQEWSDVPRGLPLFESILVFENYPVDASLRKQTGSLTVEEVRSIEQTNYPITVVSGAGERLPLKIAYDRRRFDADAIRRMLGHLETLLEGIAAAPDRPIATLPLLTADERQQVVVTWNATATDYPQDATVHRLFEAQAARTPDAVALVAGDRVLTYRELNRRANQLAHHLQKLGVGPETLVGVHLERSPEMVIALLAVLKAGGAYLPLDPTYPPERLAFMLQDAAVSVLLVDSRGAEAMEAMRDEATEALRNEAPRAEANEALRNEAPGAEASLRPQTSDLGPQTAAKTPAAKTLSATPLSATPLAAIRLDDWSAFAHEPDTNPDAPVAPDHLAYVIYTSGSTGLPKGVTVPQRALVNHALTMKDAFGLEPGDRFLQFISLSFDASAEEIFPTLLGGATLVLAPPDLSLAGPDFLRFCEDQAVTVLHLPASFWHQWVDDLALAGLPVRIPLKLLVVGGESPAVDRLETWLHLLGRPIRFINAYGPTEATITTTFYALACDPETPIGLTRIPIGWPIANVRTYLLDREGRPVPPGVPGELYIGGVGVARGYLHRPDLTAERFLPDPFDDRPGARLYRTGDLARYRPDGAIEFLGRVDYQVKVRGFRIELEEIEAVLQAHPAVDQAVVLAREDTPGEKQLVAYLVTGDDAPLPVGELRDYLKARLPAYMVPSAYVVLEAMPLLPGGKVDRQALPAPEGAQLRPETPYVAPRTPVEEVIAEMWARVLGVERVGIHDDFFELGGHSLLAVQLISRLRRAFQIEVPLQDLFQTPTVAGLAEQVEAALRAAAGLEAPPIEPIPRDDGPPPLSFAQQRLWFLDQLAPGNLFYNIPMAVRLSGRLDVEALERSLNEIVRRHEVLRTTFREKDGRPIQVIAPELHLTLPVVDLSHLPEAEREAEARRRAQAEARQPFDLSRGPLLRAKLLKLDDEEHIAVLTMHHIISDGWSMGVLVRELATLYSAFVAGRPSPLPDPPIQYADFAAWQREWLQGEVLERQLAYWKEQLQGPPPVLDLPTDRPRPAVQSWRGATEHFALPSELSRQLRALSREEGVTLFMTLLAAFQTLLHRYTGQDDISVGTAIANRNRAEIEGLIGFFVNTLVMRTKLDGNPTFREVLKRVREVALGAYAHQDLPFEMLVEALQPERDMSHTPLFQVMFVLQNAPAEPLELPGLILTPVEVDRGTATFDLTLSMTEGPEGLSGSLEYNTDLFDAATIRRMLGHFQTLLEAVVADPDRPIARLPLLTEPEQQQMLVRWNATATDFDHDRCAHHLVEAWAARRPHAIAVTFEDQALSYAELDRRANQLAHHLQKLGVGPESLVGISTRRSPEMVIAILAVLKAGGAYLPLDPTYPPERLAFMLQDAAVSVLLVDSRGAEVAEALGNEAMRAEANEALRNEAPGAEASLRPQTSDLRPRTAAKTLSAKTLSATSLAAKPLTAIRLDNWSTFAGEPTTPPETSVSPDNLAYVIYTSGSTGKPKGTMLHHRGLCNLTDAQRRAFGIRPGSHVLQFSRLSFDGSVWEIFMALANGATLCLARQETLASAPDLIALLREAEVTNATLPPSMLRVMPLEKLPALQTIISAGEACTPELVERWSPGRDFFNGYGPTESTVCASLYLCADQEPDGPPIGRPIANVALYILDPKLQPVPIGVPGELCIDSVGLARGYLNRPDLTAERFIPNPFSDRPGARLYRTGDLVRFRPDGNIEFLGRIDHQVKVRGFRIELGEIEAVLEGHPALREVAVIAREDSPGDRRLVAYVVPESEPAPTVSELRSFLRRTLPDYMVPAAFVFLEALPLTPSGKVDRRALPAPEGLRPTLQREYVPPRTPVEQELAALCAELLGIERVGIYDNFFELGGHSLLATQFISRVRETFDVEVPLRTLFEHPTVAELAEEIEALRQTEETDVAKIAELLEKVQNLSQDEVLALLREKQVM